MADRRPPPSPKKRKEFARNRARRRAARKKVALLEDAIREQRRKLERMDKRGAPLDSVAQKLVELVDEKAELERAIAEDMPVQRKPRSGKRRGKSKGLF